MLCQNCKKREANTHIVRTVGNNTVETYLCSECAKEYGFETSFSVSDFLFGDMLSSPFMQSKTQRCPVCSSSFGEISASGKVGCGNCYKVFENELMPTVARLHSLPLHKGKSPNKASPKQQSADEPKPKTKRLTKEERIAKLKAEQEEMIKSENFEKAAELRDKIKKLEGGK